MNCPVCKNNEIQPIIIGDVKVDKCPRCLGMWFDKGEMRKAKDFKLEDANWFDIDLWNDESAFRAKEGDKMCPVCRINLYKLDYGDSGIQIDACKRCNGIWLDRGEFEKILRYIREKSDSEVLKHYTKNLLEETKEIFTGKEGFKSELADLFMLLSLLKYKFLAQRPILSRILMNLPK